MNYSFVWKIKSKGKWTSVLVFKIHFYINLLTSFGCRIKSVKLIFFNSLEIGDQEN